jgi:hypothetical protein
MEGVLQSVGGGRIRSGSADRGGQALKLVLPAGTVVADVGGRQAAAIAAKSAPRPGDALEGGALAEIDAATTAPEPKSIPNRSGMQAMDRFTLTPATPRYGTFLILP